MLETGDAGKIPTSTLRTPDRTRYFGHWPRYANSGANVFILYVGILSPQPPYGNPARSRHRHAHLPLESTSKATGQGRNRRPRLMTGAFLMDCAITDYWSCWVSNLSMRLPRSPNLPWSADFNACTYSVDRTGSLPNISGTVGLPGNGDPNFTHSMK